MPNNPVFPVPLANPSALLVAILSLVMWSAPLLSAEHSPARLTEIALHHLHGEGVEADPDRAVSLLCRAADKGNPVAAFELGWLYLRDRAFARDDGLAAAWLDQAERLGEKLPESLARRLADVERSALRCIDRKGFNLREDYRHADLKRLIRELAPQYGLDPVLVFEVVRAESNFDTRARSHKGALGLMQLIPATAERFGVEDPFEPLQNLRGGMAYLRWLLQRFDGDLRLTLAGYNAGEGAVQRYGGIPPYAETQAYVGRILQRYGKLKASDSLI